MYTHYIYIYAFMYVLTMISNTITALVIIMIINK